MTEFVQGFDSRYWNGNMDTPMGDFQFAGIKVSQGTNFAPTLPRKQWATCGQLGVARLPFHYWKAPLLWQDAKANGVAQAEYMFAIMQEHFFINGLNELPPVLDIEDRPPAGTTNHRVRLSIIACMQRLEELFGVPPMVYTANWWFEPYFQRGYNPADYDGFDIYGYDLWEADPPPDTPCGEWPDTEILQYKLSTFVAGFNNVYNQPVQVDLNKARRKWYEDNLQSNPPNNECQQQLETLLVENRQLQAEVARLEGKINVAYGQTENVLATLDNR